MVKIVMELYDKLHLLEDKIDKLLAEVRDARGVKEQLDDKYNKLFEKYNYLEEENRRNKEDMQAARHKVESLLSRFD